MGINNQFNERLDVKILEKYQANSERLDQVCRACEIGTPCASGVRGLLEKPSTTFPPQAQTSQDYGMQPIFSLLCPSRARPERFQNMLRSAIAMADAPFNIVVELHVDADDPALETYREVAMTTVLNVRLIFSDTKRPVPQIFDASARCAKGDILMLCADDLIFRTRGWDRKVLEAFAKYPDGLGLFYSNDGRDREKAEHWFVSRRWVEVVGFFSWAGDCGGLGPFEHFCADTVAELVAHRVGRIFFLGDVVTEHMHEKYGKAENDVTYQEKRERGRDGRTPSDRDQDRLAMLGPVIDAAARRGSDVPPIKHWNRN